MLVYQYLIYDVNIQRFYFSALDDYQSCNIDKRPAHAFVTSASKSKEDVEKYKKLLKNAKLGDLKKGGIVGNGTESLQEFTGTLKKYLEPYSLYYKAVNKTEDK